MIKRKLAMILASAMLLGLAGCSNGSGSKATVSTGSNAPVVNLSFYYPTQVGGDLANGMENIVSGFNKTHSKIHVTPVYTGSYKQTAQKAMTDLAAGKGPNVILSGMLDIVDYYNVGKAEDLTPLIEQEGKAWKSDFVDGFWGNFVMHDGKTYGIPFQHSVCVLYYNKDMLKAAGAAVPTSWDGILKASAALKAHNSKTVTIEFPSDVWVLEALTLSDSGSLVKNSTQTSFDSQPAVDSLDLLSKLVKSGGMINSYASAAEDFVAGSSAMMLNTTGNLGFTAKDATFNWDVGMVPVKTNPGFSYGGGGLIMTAHQTAAQKAASWEFMTYMTSPKISAQWMTVSGYFAVRKSANTLQTAKNYYNSHPQLKHAADLLKYSKAQWTTAHYWDVYACMQTALDSVLIKGSTSPSAALTKAQTDSMTILKK